MDSSEKAVEPKKMPEILQELQNEFSKLGYNYWNKIPSYLPDGFEEGEVITSVTEYTTNIFCRITNGSDYILLQYRIFDSETTGNIAYEKDLDEPERYDAGGVEHYITTDMGKYKAVWKAGEIECGIFEVSDKNESSYD